MLLSPETSYGVKMTCKCALVFVDFVVIYLLSGKSFVEIDKYLFTVPGVNSFLSQRHCQDPLKVLFGCQRQRGRVNDNLNVAEFLNNTHSSGNSGDRVILSSPHSWKLPRESGWATR